jgi:uncharacterized SAM-binding protein YcdF (DUF218 family)
MNTNNNMFSNFTVVLIQFFILFLSFIRLIICCVPVSHFVNMKFEVLFLGLLNTCVFLKYRKG